MAGGSFSPVCFEVHCSMTYIGEHIRVVGTLPELGHWDPQCSTVELRTTAREFPVWKSDWCCLPHGQWEYKYVICRDHGRSPRWEENRGNRKMLLSGSAEEAMDRIIRVTEEFDGSRLRLSEEPMDISPRTFAWASRTDICTSDFGRLSDVNNAHILASCSSYISCSESPQLSNVSECLYHLPTIQDNVYEDKSSSSKSSVVSQDQSSVERERSASLSTAIYMTPATMVSPRPGLMRRRATLGCPADLLPAGMVPTKRAVGFCNGDGGGLVREAMFNDAAASTPSSPAKLKFSSRFSDASTHCTGARSTFHASDEVTEEDSDKDSWQTSHEEDKDTREPSEDEKSSNSSQNSPIPEVSGFDGNFETRHRIGQGAYGVVYACASKSASGDRNLDCAVKVVQRSSLNEFALEQLLGNEAKGKEGEISLHRSLQKHRNIVCLRACFLESWGFRLILDLCHGGDLFDELLRIKMRNRAVYSSFQGSLTEQASRAVVQQVLSAVAFCHANGVVHRDIKAENILLERPTSQVPLESPSAVVKICDFGLSARCRSSDPALDDPVGSPDYIAPEVARMERYGNKVDVWSVGAVLFVCLRGCMPFPAKTDVEAVNMARGGCAVYDDSWKTISDDARSCVHYLMQPDVALRPSAEEGSKHSWIVN